MEQAQQKKEESWRDAVRESLLEGNTPYAKILDVILILLILASIAAAILETIDPIALQYGHLLRNLEWLFTIIFTIEYLLRAVCAKEPTSYVFSLSGIIDLISILPLYISLVFAGERLLNLIRLLRFVRIISRLFRISKSISNNSYFKQNLINHLGTDEQLVYYFKPARRQYFFGYLFMFVLLVLALAEIIFDYFTLFFRLDSITLQVIGYVLLLLSFFLLVRYELIIWYTRFGITSQRIIQSSGIVHEDFRSTTFAYIADIHLYQSLWDKILGIGDVNIRTTGSEHDNLNLENISNPMKLKRIIHDSIIKHHAGTHVSPHVAHKNP